MVENLKGAEYVIGVDVSRQELDLGRKMGTNVVRNPKETNVADESKSPS
jgi:Zn-dependent alcohol dehydrogenase